MLFSRNLFKNCDLLQLECFYDFSTSLSTLGNSAIFLHRARRIHADFRYNLYEIVFQC